MAKLIVITHYPRCDKEFMSDYVSIDLCLSNGEIIASWGDHYHDRGQEKLEGFIQGVKWSTGIFDVDWGADKVEYQCVADAEDWGEGCEDAIEETNADR